MLRQDPDVILVGETRDQETAAMVLKAALTGHLVMTTVHSASATGVFYRLQDLGVKLGHLSDLLLAVLAQRLVRALCQSCKQKVDVPGCLRAQLPDAECIYIAGSCPDCAGSGYRGRLAVVECCVRMHKCMRVGRRLFGRGVGGKRLQTGHQSLWHNAVSHIAQGKTSPLEVQRVLGDPLLAQRREGHS